MGIVEEFEKRVEKLVEGVFSKAFRSNVEPSEIGRRLLREMESSKSVSVGAVYVPNVYLIDLAAADLERLGGLLPALAKEFSELLTETAASRKWKLAGPVTVEFRLGESVREGRFDVAISHREMPALQVQEDYATLSLVGSEPLQSWRLSAGSEPTIGRGESNEIVIDDPNASRTHARLFLESGAWSLSDLDSLNGTLINDRQAKQTRLTSGDVITIGTTQLQFSSELGGFGGVAAPNTNDSGAPEAANPPKSGRG